MPVSAWYKVCSGQSYRFLLESVEDGGKIGALYVCLVVT